LFLLPVTSWSWEQWLADRNCNLTWAENHGREVDGILHIFQSFIFDGGDNPHTDLSED